MTGRYVLVISNGVLKNASDVFNILDPDAGGSYTFTVPLSVDGTGEPTHWAAYTQLQEPTYNALKNMTTPQLRAYVDQLTIERGREPVGSITAFPNSLQMSEEDEPFYDFLDRIGLVQLGHGQQEMP